MTSTSSDWTTDLQLSSLYYTAIQRMFVSYKRKHLSLFCLWSTLLLCTCMSPALTCGTRHNGHRLPSIASVVREARMGCLYITNNLPSTTNAYHDKWNWPHLVVNLRRTHISTWCASDGIRENTIYAHNRKPVWHSAYLNVICLIQTAHIMNARKTITDVMTIQNVNMEQHLVQIKSVTVRILIQ
jgi:hypothetical protein